tara:strand:+ start:234 stop:425 length:192 start_codon:yes stop_codon:yes gene_type:complete
LANFTFNPKIIEKIDSLEQDESYKEFLKGIIEFEKDQDKLGDIKYTQEYDKRFLKLLEDIGDF